MRRIDSCITQPEINDILGPVTRNTQAGKKQVKPEMAPLAKVRERDSGGRSRLTLVGGYICPLELTDSFRQQQLSLIQMMGESDLDDNSRVNDCV